MPQWRGCKLPASVPKKEKTDCKGDGSCKPLPSGGLHAYTETRISLLAISTTLLNEGGDRRYRCSAMRRFSQERHLNSDYFDAKDDSLRIEPGRSRRLGPLTKGLPRS